MHRNTNPMNSFAIEFVVLQLDRKHTLVVKQSDKTQAVDLKQAD